MENLNEHGRDFYGFYPGVPAIFLKDNWSCLKDNRGRIHCPVMSVTVSLTATGITYISNRRQALLFGITLPCHIFLLEPLDFMTLRTYNTFRRRKEELLWPKFMRS